MAFPVNPQELEDFIDRVTADKTAALIQSMEERFQSEISAAVTATVQERIASALEGTQQAAEVERQEALSAREAMAAELSRARETATAALTELRSKVSLISQDIVDLEDKIKASLAEEVKEASVEAALTAVRDFVIKEVKSANAQSRTQTVDIVHRSERVIREHLEAVVGNNIEKFATIDGEVAQLHEKINASAAAAEGVTHDSWTAPEAGRRESATHGTDGRQDENTRDDGAAQAQPERYTISSPPGYDDHGDEAPRRRPDREIRVIKPTYDKLALKELKSEAGFKAFAKSLDMALDDVWVGIENLLKEIRNRKSRISPEDFDELVARAQLRPADVRAEDWSFKVISRYVFGILYRHTDSDLQGIVEQCEDDKDGIEAYRLLANHCDPMNYNTSNILMEEITKLGHRKVSTNPMTAIDEFLSTVREVKKRLGDYERRVEKLPGATTTWIPSMMVSLMDGDMLTFVRHENASGDLDKMEACIKELRQIKKSVGARPNLRQFVERQPEAEEEEPQEEDEDFEEWASDPATTKDQLLAAIGKGGGKGGRPPPRFGNGRKGQQQRTATAKRPTGPVPPSAPGDNKTEKRKCFNCGEIGHIGKDCPLPDRRLTDGKKSSKPQQGSAKSLVDAEGFQTVAKGPRQRLCMMKTRAGLKPMSSKTNRFTLLRPSEDATCGECACDDGVNQESVHVSTAQEFVMDIEMFPSASKHESKSNRAKMPAISKKKPQRTRFSRPDQTRVLKDRTERTAREKGIDYKDHQKIEPPPEVPDSSFQRPIKTSARSRVSRFGSGKSRMQCQDNCDCTESPAQVRALDAELDAQDSQDDDDDDVATPPGLADSDSEDEIPDTPDHVLSAKQLDARIKRREREEMRELRRAREKRIDAENEQYCHQDLHGSSVDLPLTADDARHGRLYHEDNPRVDRGETHHTADSNEDLLHSSDGTISLESVFGSMMPNPYGLKSRHESMFLLYEKRGVLNAVNPKWERLTLTVDSGASDTVVPRTVCSLAPLVKGARFGTEYEIANGDTVDNEGERNCLMRTSESDGSDESAMEVQFQVVDVSKALLSVHRVCEQGHKVLFAGKDEDSAILINGNPQDRIPLRNCGGTYELDVWVKPNPSPGFARPR